MSKKYRAHYPVRPSSGRALWAGGLLILLLLLGLAVYNGQLPGPAVIPRLAAQKPSNRPVTTPEQSLRLRIPKIKVDAAVVGVGLNAAGDMDNPVTPELVGWYRNGPRPGEAGSAVITGHYGWKGGRAAAFDNLHQLQAGDEVVIDDKGTSKTFVVRTSRVYDPEAKVPEVFSSTDGMQHLNLITCQGTWNQTKHSYSQRLVVFTDLQS